MSDYQINREGANARPSAGPNGSRKKPTALPTGSKKQETTVYATLKTAFAAVIVLGSATFALADDGTALSIDTSRPAFKSSNVSLPQRHTIYIDYDHAGANHDNGGN
jgi:hypothetical protein